MLCMFDPGDMTIIFLASVCLAAYPRPSGVPGLPFGVNDKAVANLGFGAERITAASIFACLLMAVDAATLAEREPFEAFGAGAAALAFFVGVNSSASCFAFVRALVSFFFFAGGGGGTDASLSSLSSSVVVTTLWCRFLVLPDDFVPALEPVFCAIVRVVSAAGPILTMASSGSLLCRSRNRKGRGCGSSPSSVSLKLARRWLSQTIRSFSVIDANLAKRCTRPLASTGKFLKNNSWSLQSRSKLNFPFPLILNPSTFSVQVMITLGCEC